MYSELEAVSAPRAFSQPEPLIAAQLLTHVTFERRNPGKMVEFLTDFGFVRIADVNGRLYLRCYGDSAPFNIEIVPGAADAFIGFGLGASARSDLDRLAAETGATVQTEKRPGGGSCLRLSDPDGVSVDLIWRDSATAPLSVRSAIAGTNGPGRAERINRPVRTSATPAPVVRLGHIVLQVTDLNRSLRWYMRHFGFLLSDVQLVGDALPVLAFSRFNRGAKPTDHHSLALLGGPKASLAHVSTETLDIDAVGQGQQYLRSRGWKHHWGLGRHVLGSQFFDYWKDPAGDEWEHYADGDLLTADYPTGYWKLALGTLWAWGHDLPPGLAPAEPPPPDAPAEVHELFRVLTAPARSWMR